MLPDVYAITNDVQTSKYFRNFSYKYYYIHSIYMLVPEYINS